MLRIRRWLCCLMLLCTAGHAQPATDPVLQLDIPAQSMTDALNEFARQSGLQVLMDWNDSRKLKSPRIRGAFTATAALRRMLSESGLQYEYLDARTISVRARKPQGNGADSSAAAPGPMANAALQLARVAASGDTTEPGSAERSTATGQEQDENDTAGIVVTGTLLRGVNPVSSTITLTRDDIERLGVHSAEDIIRSLPQNYSSLNSASGFANTNELFNNVFTPDAQGTATVNLRGLGAGASLVLLNGRRVAGMSIAEGSAANLSAIPSSAIERVEILLDGASAVYGSDAIGGVVNFIMKQDTGPAATSNARYEHSSSGGDMYSVSQYLSAGWNSGRLSATMSYADNDPAQSARIGYVSSDLTAMGGTDWIAELGRAAAPGIVYADSSQNVLLGSLPPDSDGTQWALDDLQAPQSFTDETYHPNLTPQRRNIGAVFNLEQSIGSSLSAFVDAQYGRSDTDAARHVPLLVGTVPASNAHNSTGDTLYVAYAFDAEVAAGLLPRLQSESNHELLNLSAGADWDLPLPGWRAQLSGGYSETTNTYNSVSVATSSLANPLVTELLASSDPAEALNPFGNGTVQSSRIRELITADNASSSSYVYSGSIKADGMLATLPGGAVRLALGGEFREEHLDYTRDSGRAGVPVERPRREISALFTEVAVPLIGADNALPAVRSLTLSAAGRWEEYRFTTLPPGDPIFNPNPLQDAPTFSNVSPKAGLAWRPVDDVLVRLTWSEAFSAPTYSRILEPESSAGEIFFPMFDPVRNELLLPGDGVLFSLAGNPGLKPQSSENTTVGVEWTPRRVAGLKADITYNKIRFTDRIQTFFPFPGFYNPEITLAIFSNPEIVQRDANGRVTKFISLPVNVSLRRSETIDFGLDYRFNAGATAFRTGISGAYIMTLEDALTPGQPATPIVGQFNGPSAWSGRLFAGLSRENLGIDATMNYSSSYGYENFNFGLPPQHIQHYTTVDLTGFYRLDGGWKISAGARNLFDADFPFIDAFFRPFDASRVDVRGRIVYMEVEKSFDF